MEAYPDYPSMDGGYITQRKQRHCYIKGFERAEKDIISHIREQIERWMPKDNGEEYLKGERTAFISVLRLLKEMEEEYNDEERTY